MTKNQILKDESYGLKVINNTQENHNNYKPINNASNQSIMQISSSPAVKSNILSKDPIEQFKSYPKQNKGSILFLRASTGWKDPSPPLAFSYLGAIAKQEGFKVYVENLNAIYNKTTEEEVIELIKNENPIVGISVSTNYALDTYKLMNKIRPYCSLIVAGGPHVTGYAEEVINRGKADIAIYGEAEFAFADVINRLVKGIDYNKIPGIVFKETNPITKESKFIRTLPSESFDLDLLPYPDRNVHRKDDYVKVKEDINNFGGILSSRGCPGKCTFCYQSMFGHEFRYRSAENIFKEVKYLYEYYGITHINFIDDVFTTNKKRLKELCDILIREKLPIEWVCATRVDYLTKELIDKMKEAGCVMISLGVESNIPETLLKIKKTGNPEWYSKQVNNLLQWCKEAGIRIGVNILTGFPWDTPENLRKLQEYVKKISPYVTQNFCGGILQPMPDTEIYHDYVDEYEFKNWWLYEGDKKQLFDDDYHPFFMLNYLPFWEQLNNNWFNLNKDVFNEIDNLYKIMGKWNMWNSVKRRFQSPVKRYIVYTGLFTISQLSLFIYKLSPKLEETLFSPLITLSYTFKHKK